MSLWLDRSLVVTTEGPSGTSLTTVAQPFLRVGSDPESDILLPGVARRSVYVHATPEGIYGVVLSEATHAIYPPEHWFRPDDPLEIGAYRMWVAFEHGDSRPPPAAGLISWGSASLPRPVVEVFHGKQHVGKRRFSASLNLIGRRYQCALQLKGFNVSEFHCAIYWNYGRMWCVDLNSSNGTLLNGRRIPAAEIRMGDELEVGDFRLLYRRLSRSGARGGSLAANRAELPFPTTDLTSADGAPSGMPPTGKPRSGQIVAATAARSNGTRESEVVPLDLTMLDAGANAVAAAGRTAPVAPPNSEPLDTQPSRSTEPVREPTRPTVNPPPSAWPPRGKEVAGRSEAEFAIQDLSERDDTRAPGLGAQEPDDPFAWLLPATSQAGSSAFDEPHTGPGADDNTPSAASTPDESPECAGAGESPAEAAEVIATLPEANLAGTTIPGAQLPAEWREALQRLADEQAQLHAEVERLAAERRALALEREALAQAALERQEPGVPPPPLAPAALAAGTESCTPQVPNELIPERDSLDAESLDSESCHTESLDTESFDYEATTRAAGPEELPLELQLAAASEDKFPAVEPAVGELAAVVDPPPLALEVFPFLPQAVLPEPAISSDIAEPLPATQVGPDLLEGVALGTDPECPNVPLSVPAPAHEGHAAELEPCPIDLVEFPAAEPAAEIISAPAAFGSAAGEHEASSVGFGPGAAPADWADAGDGLCAPLETPPRASAHPPLAQKSFDAVEAEVTRTELERAPSPWEDSEILPENPQVDLDFTTTEPAAHDVAAEASEPKPAAGVIEVASRATESDFPFVERDAPTDWKSAARELGSPAPELTCPAATGPAPAEERGSDSTEQRQHLHRLEAATAQPVLPSVESQPCTKEVGGSTPAFESCEFDGDAVGAEPVGANESAELEAELRIPGDSPAAIQGALDTASCVSESTREEQEEPLIEPDPPATAPNFPWVTPQAFTAEPESLAAAPDLLALHLPSPAVDREASAARGESLEVDPQAPAGTPDSSPAALPWFAGELQESAAGLEFPGVEPQPPDDPERLGTVAGEAPASELELSLDLAALRDMRPKSTGVFETGAAAAASLAAQPRPPAATGDELATELAAAEPEPGPLPRVRIENGTASVPRTDFALRQQKRDELATLVLDRLDEPRSLWRWAWLWGSLAVALIAAAAVGGLIYTGVLPVGGSGA